MTTMPLAYVPGSDRPRRAAGQGLALGCERLAVLLIPVVEAASTTLGALPFYDGLKAALFAGLFGVAAAATRPPREMRRRGLRWLLVLLGAYTVTSRLFHLGASGAGVEAFLAALLTLPALLWLLNASFSAEAFRSLMTWFVVGAAIAATLSSGLAIQVLLDSGVRGWARVSIEVSANRNAVAPLYVMALAALIFLPLNLRRGWATVCAGLIFTALLLLFSRSGYIALALPLILALCAGGAARRATLPLLAIAAAALLVPGSPIADRIGYTFEGSGTNALDDSAATRLDLWRAAIADFQDKPFFGSGSGNSSLPSYDVRRADILYTHNYFLTQLSQLGVVGFALTIAAIVRFATYAFRWDGAERYFALSFLAAILVLSVTGEPLYGLAAYIHYAVAIFVSRPFELGRGR